MILVNQKVGDMNKKCNGCGQIKTEDKFYRNPSCKDGLNPYCKGCHLKKSKIFSYKNIPQRKECRSCLKTLPKEKFYNVSSSEDGLSIYCQKCHKKKSMAASINAGHPTAPRETRICIRTDCQVSFVVKKSSPKKYCSHKCVGIATSSRRDKNSEGHLKCSCCNKYKDRSQFYVDNSSPDKCSSYCKSCMLENKKEDYKQNAEKLKRSDRYAEKLIKSQVNLKRVPDSLVQLKKVHLKTKRLIKRKEESHDQC